MLCVTDITLDAGEGFFNFRVGAVIIREGRLLMVKNENAPYYYSPGGRVRFTESTRSAAMREVLEETGTRLEIERLAFIHENFFEAEFAGGRRCHEIALFYLMKECKDASGMMCETLGTGGGAESLHWLPLDRLAEYPVYPEFFKTELKAIGAGVGHFITRDGHTARL